MTFEHWLAEVEEWVRQIAGLELTDLPDERDLHGDWDGEVSPKQAALEVLANAGWVA